MRRRVIALFLVALTAIRPALADTFAGRVEARYDRANEAYDADSFDLIALPWPGITIAVKVRARLVDAPEIKGKCQAEKDLARKARDAVRELLGHAHTIVLSDIDVKSDPYGRVLATIEADGIKLHEWLMIQGLARPYGDGRKSWCDENGELIP